MRVLLVSANTERINMPTLPLGLALVAAATRQSGHEVAFLDLLTEAAPKSAVEKAVRTFFPEVVGICVRNIDDQNIDTAEFLLERVKDVVSACRRRTRWNCAERSRPNGWTSSGGASFIRTTCQKNW